MRIDVGATRFGSPKLTNGDEEMAKAKETAHFKYRVFAVSEQKTEK